MTVRKNSLAFTAAVGVAVLLSACAGSAPASETPTSSAPTTASSQTSTANAASVSDWGCTLLTRAQVEKLLGARVIIAHASTSSDWTDVSGCQYTTATTLALAITVAQHNTLVGDPALAPPGAPSGTTCLPETPVTTCILDLPDGNSLIVITTPDPRPMAATLSLAARAYAGNPMPHV